MIPAAQHGWHWTVTSSNSNTHPIERTWNSIKVPLKPIEFDQSPKKSHWTLKFPWKIPNKIPWRSHEFTNKAPLQGFYGWLCCWWRSRGRHLTWSACVSGNGVYPKHGYLIGGNMMIDYGICGCFIFRPTQIYVYDFVCTVYVIMQWVYYNYEIHWKRYPLVV